MDVPNDNKGPEVLYSSRDFDRIACDSIDGLHAAFSSVVDMAYVLPSDPRTKICSGGFESDVLPASMDESPKSEISFNIRQFSYLSRLVAFSEEFTFRDLSRLYIGSALGFRVLNELMLPHDSLVTDRVCTILTDTTGIDTAVRTSPLDNDAQNAQLFDVMKSDEARIGQINALRFCVGLLFEGEKARGNEGFGLATMTAFRKTLQQTLKQEKNYTELFKEITGSESRARRMFERHVKGVSLAVSFPMSRPDVVNLLEVCRGKKEIIPPFEQVNVITAADIEGKYFIVEPNRQSDQG